jgi:hypothetical protein
MRFIFIFLKKKIKDAAAIPHANQLVANQNDRNKKQSIAFVINLLFLYLINTN